MSQTPSLDTWTQQLRQTQEIILANTLMLGEMPGAPGQEEPRVKFLAERLTSSGLREVSVDEALNVQAVIPGRKRQRRFLLAAHLDTLTQSKSHNTHGTINCSSTGLHGPGIADNTLGVAVLGALPEILSTLNLQFDADLVLLGHVRSLGKENLHGLRFFLENVPLQFDAGLVMEGITLGRLNHLCLGMVQAEITCQVHQEPGTRWEAAENAMIIMHRIIRHILEIPIPQEPRTSLILGSLTAGTTFNRPPETARLQLEIRSEIPGKAREIRHRISDILDQISAETASQCTIEFPALRKPGGIPFTHPLVAAARNVHKELGIQTITGPSYSDLSQLIAHQIPALTLGLTFAHNLNTRDELVELPPLYQGIAQIIGILHQLDQKIPADALTTPQPQENTQLA